MSRNHRVLLLLLLLIPATAWFAWRTAHRRNTGDLIVYYEAGERLRAGHDLYREYESTERPGFPTGYIYPPPFALAMAPVSLLPFKLVRGLWFVLGVLCAARALVLAHRLIARVRPPPTDRAALAALALGIAFAARAIWNDLGHGQVNLILVALTLEAVWAAERRRDVLAGALFAAAVVLKIVPALLLVAYVLQRRWRLVGTAAGVSLLLLLSPAVLAGLAATWDFTIRFVTDATAWHAGYAISLPNNVTPTGAVFRVLVGASPAFGEPHQPLAWSLDAGLVRGLCTVGSLLMFVGVLAGTARTWGADPTEPEDAPPPQRARNLALLCAAVPLISPVAWKPHLVWLILPGLLAGRLLLVPGRHRRWLAAAFVLTVLTSRFPLGKELSLQAYLWGLPALGLILLFVGLCRAPLALDDPEPTPGTHTRVSSVGTIEASSPGCVSSPQIP